MMREVSIIFGPYTLNSVGRQLLRNGERVVLGSRSLDILIALVERAGEVISARELVERAWPGLVMEDGNLRVTIAGLRKALGDGKDGARYIVNVPSRGYCFVSTVDRGEVRPDHPPVISLKVNPPSWRTEGLPVRHGHIVGRADAVEAIRSLLTEHRFINIVGPGGMGKTTVAISVAYAAMEDFKGQICFADLGALSDPALVATAVAASAGVSVQLGDPIPSLIASAANRPFLIVLDNCEHLIEAAATFAEILYRNAPQASILATSREALRVEGERVHLLTPLDGPPDGQEITASRAMASPAVQLFMERAFASGRQGVLTDDEAPLVAEICRRLDGIALAIELAGSRVGVLGIQGTAELLNSRFRLQWQGRRSALPRHQTLQALLDWSFNLLTENERIILSRCSVFVGFFAPEAALAVTKGDSSVELDVANAVASLIDKSLITSSIIHGAARLRLLDTTRAYATNKLLALAEDQLMSRRHAIYYAETIAALFGANGAKLDAAQLIVFSSQLGNLRAALTWSFSQSGDHRLAAELAGRASRVFLGLSLLTECHYWCEKAISLPLNNDELRLNLQKGLAISAMFTRGNTPGVRIAIEQGLKLAEQLGERQHEMNLLAGLHIFMTRIGDFHGAVAVARRSTEVAALDGVPASAAMAEWMLGCACHLIGDQAAAQRHCEQGLKLAAAVAPSDVDFFGYDHRIRALIVFARALWLGGKVDRAAEVARQAIDEADRRGDPVNRCIAMIYTATVFLWRGDLEEVEDHLECLMEYAKTHSLRPYVAVGMALTGELAILKGEARCGVERLREALLVLQAEEHNVLTSTFRRALAMGLLAIGEIDEADAVINAALAEAQVRGHAVDLPELFRSWVEIGLASRRITFKEAEATLQEAIKCARDCSSLSLELRSACTLARLLLQTGQIDQARKLLAPIYNRFDDGFQTADLRVARRLLTDLGEIRAADIPA